MELGRSRDVNVLKRRSSDDAVVYACSWRRCPKERGEVVSHEAVEAVEVSTWNGIENDGLTV
jgi:hypothetical protein